jgi:3-oxoacyl-[acyl-carrier protein] reductase
MKKTFDGRVVLVVGSRGLVGESLCRFFLERGAKVVGCSRSQATIEPEHFHHYICDIGDEQAVLKMFYLLDQAQMSPDSVILSAGAFSTNMVALLSSREMDSILSTNVKGALLIAREAVKRMTRKRFGRIIALSSISVSRTERGAALYSMSKAALEQLIRVLPLEVGDYPVTFNAIEISLLDGGMARDLSKEARARLMDLLAVKRFCTPQDLCNAVEFFAKTESSYVTGQVLKLGFV